jgi:hypothetical protein
MVSPFWNVVFQDSYTVRGAESSISSQRHDGILRRQMREDGKLQFSGAKNCGFS